ncbi:BnaAnng38890D [Brassica napus]|uniref:(rape) hypothetical protein n=1 Tax=Brassica napus TaxID=3708 RepID=A0A078JYS6_BRANA|nr:unnamed protein product [Brassica napus]CDY71824.1 BnaAnng38890D [Brassica napus]
MVMAICAACEFMTGPCTFGNGNACIMAPYFPSTEPAKFDRVNKVFGVVNARIHDPIHGYLGPQMNLFLFSLTNEMLELNEDQKNQLRGLPDVDARRNVDEIVGMRENNQGDVLRADGASTSSGPSSAPPNQNQP